MKSLSLKFQLSVMSLVTFKLASKYKEPYIYYCLIESSNYIMWMQAHSKGANQSMTNA